MKTVLILICTAALGIVLVLAGLGIDAWLHARDATLAEREGIFSLSNPGHVLLGAGVAFSAAGLLGALYVAWGMTNPPGMLGQRWLRVVTMQGAAIAAIGAVIFAISLSADGHPHDDTHATAGDAHDRSATQSAADPPVAEHPDEVMHDAPMAARPMPAEPMDMPAHTEPAPEPALVSVQPAAAEHPHAPPPAPVTNAPAPPPMEHPQETAPAPMPEMPPADHGHSESPAAPVDASCADAYVETVRAATKRFEDFDVAVAEGFYKSTPGNVVAHYANRAYIRDGVLVDPAKPEVLMYVNTKSGMRLAGIMYLGLPNTAHPEICGGSATWHGHPEVCITDAGMVVGFSQKGKCTNGNPVLLPEMLHVWLVPNPAGVFDEHMDPAWLLDQFQ